MDVPPPWNYFALVLLIGLIVLPSLFEWRRNRPVKDPPEETPYRIYTTEFDIEIRAEDVAGRLSEISPHHRKQWKEEGDAEWVSTVQAAKQKTKQFEEQNLLASLPADLSDFAISLLVDHSGSMRGDKIQAAASTVHALTAALTTKGAKVEVLGYTTAGWRGGFARRKWMENGRPRYPGRLCALMHIVYKAAEDEQFADGAFEVMLNPGILHENIDGEAIEWAERRLLAQPEKQRLLFVFSDGAPVDDSTLIQNGPSILWWHIKQVIARIEAEQPIVLAAIGVNYRVDGFYANSTWTDDGSRLLEVTSAFIEKTISAN